MLVIQKLIFVVCVTWGFVSGSIPQPSCLSQDGPSIVTNDCLQALAKWPKGSAPNDHYILYYDKSGEYISGSCKVSLSTQNKGGISIPYSAVYNALFDPNNGITSFCVTKHGSTTVPDGSLILTPPTGLIVTTSYSPPP